MSPFAVSFTQIRALDSKPECIYAVHRRCRGQHQKAAQSCLINCSLSGTVFCSAQFSGKIWELNVEAKRIHTALTPTHWNAAKARALSCKTLSLLPQPSKGLSQPSRYRLTRVPLDADSSAWMRCWSTAVLSTDDCLVEAHSCTGCICDLYPMNIQEGKNFPLFTLILHTTTTLFTNRYLSAFESFTPCRMKAHFIWTRWQFITEAVIETNREV